MTRRQTFIFGLLATSIAIAAGSLSYLLFGDGSLAKGIPPAGLARLHAMSFGDLDGKQQAVAQWRGKTLVVNFWATWCPPCRQEMPGFSRLQEKLGARGVQFVGIGIDSPSAIKEFALRYPVSYPLLVGGSEGMDLLRALGNPNAALPYTLVLDPAGETLFSRLGLVEEESLERVLLQTPDAGRTVR